ncbi:hypothetical protein SEA_THERESITA_37 [Microbacterium phage Theresita]|nr:hypothetical protein SEA_THERESITA_37 [Microbacterium phage Theresita]
MSPFDVMFWALAGVVVVGAVALAVVIVAGVIQAFTRKKPKPNSTQIMRGGDDG